MAHIRWQDRLVVLIGIALLAAPFLLTAALPEGTPAFGPRVGFVVTGFAVAVLGVLSVNTGGKLWEEWLIGLAGLWLVSMPWALAFNGVRWLMWPSIAGGVLLIVLALSALRDIVIGQT
ncbi:SPW repeat domain-containing protein [Paracoccus benzoatiresistens]|uniref:SPW repeat protein n=1 Tax=Paracoccus benzoatiresistens TaxID=2997341 RepID=A0ABT4JAY1_9RHOB|nr:SPW repeat protein [Paracoccus sp. EF6]MCZ0964059.1 SPW repeat protein [Paracoccus sp. EF6]